MVPWFQAPELAGTGAAGEAGVLSVLPGPAPASWGLGAGASGLLASS